MSEVWIAGCGDLGRATGLLLARNGHRVLGLRRHPPGPEEAPGFRYAAADLNDADSLDCLTGRPRYLLYMPAAPSISEAAYAATYPGGLTNLLDRLDRRGRLPEVLVFVSSTAVYGDAEGGWVDEATECRPDGFRGRLMLEAERVARDFPVVSRVARLTGIYGPGRTALLRRVAEGRGCRPGHYGNRIHRTDAARMLVHLLNARLEDDLWLGVDDAPAPECEVMDWLATAMGLPAPPREESDGSSRGNKRCSNARLRRSGFEFTYPTYREGYGAMIEGGWQ